MENGTSWQDSETQIPRSYRAKCSLSESVSSQKNSRCLAKFEKREKMFSIIAFG